jgi:LPS O-antigen subunit length determinant protein (WzzB/FepE family)
MEEMQSINKNNNYDHEIDLQELFSILWLGKRIIILMTLFISILGVVYSLNLPNIYKSTAILSPANSSSSISKSLQNYAGLAGLAGVSLPSSTENTNAIQAMQKLKSLSFFESSIFPNIFLPDLMAVETWDSKTNTINYKNELYDKKTSTWVRNYSYPRQKIPSAQESYKVFRTEHFSVSKDSRTDFITINIKHQSPFVAKKWIDLIVNKINSFYRQKDKLDSEKAVSYLNKQISSTNLAEVKEAISQIIQDETRKLALIEAKEYYVFDYIDPPAVMELKSEPQRALICIMSAVVGFLLGIIIVFIKHYFLQKR